MKSGASYFFNRERPGAVEFRTPLASGAIRGTEFHLTVAENGRTELALLNGLVDLQNEFGAAYLSSGEHATVDPGQPPRKTAMLEASSVMQWVLY
jgi:ferric-dicitrate binding protein FerR (iron transport regulator)